MNDRELLEMAAKAADVDAQWRPNVATGGEWLAVAEDDGWVEWNPLLHDDDALRLSVKLNMSVSMGPVEVSANTISGALRNAFFRESRITQNACTATRRVIVLAAAEVGRSM